MEHIKSLYGFNYTKEFNNNVVKCLSNTPISYNKLKRPKKSQLKPPAFHYNRPTSNFAALNINVMGVICSFLDAENIYKLALILNRPVLLKFVNIGYSHNLHTLLVFNYTPNNAPHLIDNDVFWTLIVDNPKYYYIAHKNRNKLGKRERKILKIFKKHSFWDACELFMDDLEPMSPGTERAVYDF